MSVLIAHNLTKGETFYLEARVRDESGVYDVLDAVTLTVVTGLPGVTAAQTADVGGFEVKAPKASTTTWDVGIHDVQVWAEYPVTEAIEDELLLTIQTQVE